MNPKSTPHLFALAHGRRCVGQHSCFYCAADCDETYLAETYVADTFTGRNSVLRPLSKFVCAGCVLCLQEDDLVPLCDGTTRRITKAAVRACSWVVTSEKVTAALKSHIPWLRGQCLDPPAAPRAIAIAVSGQKHLLYRTPLDFGGDTVTVQLEEEVVRYRPCDLRQRLEMAEAVVSWSGKPALFDHSAGLRADTFERAQAFGAWWLVSGQPLSRLAAFLCPSRDELNAR